MDILGFTLLGILSRLIPHIPNTTAVGSTALFVSAKFSVRKSFFVLFLTMALSDMVLGFHSVMWATYGSFLISAYMGTILGKTRQWQKIMILTFMSSLQFFVITNFAVWLSGMLYPKTISGLIECYGMALPFFRNSLLGDLLYTGLLFGGWELLQLYRAHARRYTINL